MPVPVLIPHVISLNNPVINLDSDKSRHFHTNETKLLTTTMLSQTFYSSTCGTQLKQYGSKSTLAILFANVSIHKIHNIKGLIANSPNGPYMVCKTAVKAIAPYC